MTRAGMCHDLDEQRAWEHLAMWLSCWKNNLGAPGVEYHQWIDDRTNCRAGLKATPVGGPDYKTRLKHFVLEALLAQLAPGSRDAYDVAWKHWVNFCKARGHDPM